MWPEWSSLLVSYSKLLKFLIVFMNEIQISILCNLLAKEADCLIKIGNRSVRAPLSDFENKQWNNVKIFEQF
jgi:hypothetical protein